GGFARANWDRSARIWDATMTAREWHGPEARKLVQARFEELFLRGDVLASLRDDQSIADEVRPVALELAQEWEEDPHVIHNFGLELISRPGGKAEDYARALRGYEFACRLVPEHEHYLYGLGTAQYRTGKYQDAIATLEKAERLVDDRYPARGCHPGALAFRAMAQFHLKDTKQARALLGRAREKLKHPDW